MQVFFILFSVHFAVYQYINSKCLYRTHVSYVTIYHKCTNFVPKNRQTKFVERFLLCKQAIPLLHSPMTSHDSLSHRSTYSISVARVTAV